MAKRTVELMATQRHQVKQCILFIGLEEILINESFTELLTLVPALLHFLLPVNSTLAHHKKHCAAFV